MKPKRKLKKKIALIEQLARELKRDVDLFLSIRPFLVYIDKPYKILEPERRISNQRVKIICQELEKID